MLLNTNSYLNMLCRCRNYQCPLRDRVIVQEAGPIFLRGPVIISPQGKELHRL